MTDLSGLPTDEALRDDPVYADFVLPGWHDDRLRAETEAQRAAAEAQGRQLYRYRWRGSPRCTEPLPKRSRISSKVAVS